MSRRRLSGSVGARIVLAALLMFPWVASTLQAESEAESLLKEWAELAVGGTWSHTLGDGKIEEHTYRWDAARKFVRFAAKGGPFPGDSLLGVDPQSGKLTWWNFGTDGSVGRDTMTRDADGAWRLAGKFTDAMGEHTFAVRAIKVDRNTIKTDQYLLDGKAQPGATWTRRSDPESSFADFQELGNAWVGRWVGDVTLIADWPGFGKKQGEKVVGHESVRWTADKMALEVDDFMAGSEMRMRLIWDAGNQQIKFLSMDSGGTLMEGTVYKQKPHVWAWDLRGSLHDGRRLIANGTSTFQDDNQTMLVESGEQTLGTGKTLPLRDIYKRAGK